MGLFSQIRAQHSKWSPSRETLASREASTSFPARQCSPSVTPSSTSTTRLLLRRRRPVPWGKRLLVERRTEANVLSARQRCQSTTPLRTSHESSAVTERSASRIMLASSEPHFPPELSASCLLEPTRESVLCSLSSWLADFCL